MSDFTHVGTLLNTLLYSALGVVVFWVSFIILDKVTTHDDLWKEIVENKNLAVGLVVGAMYLGLAIIIASAIH
jgi:uncharacterized membrane protein YjfL (UPF0719 family)